MGSLRTAESFQPFRRTKLGKGCSFRPLTLKERWVPGHPSPEERDSGSPTQALDRCVQARIHPAQQLGSF